MGDGKVMIVLAGAEESRFRPMACRQARFMEKPVSSGVFSTLALLCHRLQVMALVTQIRKDDFRGPGRDRDCKLKGLLYLGSTASGDSVDRSKCRSKENPANP